MVRNGEITIADARRVFRRYWWLLPICIVACTAIALVLTAVLSKKYTSQTSVLVELPTVPQDFVRPVVPDTIGMLASMRQQILSSSRLETVVDKYNLYAADRATATKDVLADRLRDSIDVSPLAGMPGTTNQLTGFRVSVMFDNPQTAHDICGELTTMFLNANAKRRENVGDVTASFLTQQLALAKENLDRQDAALADFKRKHLGYLPQEEQANLQLLGGLNSQYEATTQNISRTQQDRTFNQTILEQQEASWKQLQGGLSNPDNLAAQLQTLEEQLASLLIKYTPEHPDVVKMKAQIEDMKKRIAEDPDAATKPLSKRLREPLQQQQLRFKIQQENTTIAELTKKQGQLEQEIRVIEARVQSSPMVEQQLKELTRNYDTAVESYNDLLRKQGASRIGNDLEHQQEGERFTVLDPPSLPMEPSFPNRLKFTGAGLTLGLVLSVALMFVIAIFDKSMYSERDVEACLKVPVLTTVPTLDFASNPGVRRHEHSNSAVVFKA